MALSRLKPLHGLLLRQVRLNDKRPLEPIQRLMLAVILACGPDTCAAHASAA